LQISPGVNARRDETAGFLHDDLVGLKDGRRDPRQR
jgi:hypothetical protein